MTTKKTAAAPIASMTALRDAILEVAAAAKDGTMPLNKAGALGSLYGKAISSAVAQTNYARARKEVPRVPFMK